MKNNTLRTVLKTLYVLLIILFIAYIFSNSMESREASSAKSAGILQSINAFLEKINFPISLSDHFIRKCAHFAEFFVLGTLLFGFLCMNGLAKKQNLIYACFFGCLVAMTDETIQHFSNRGSMLLDVWLDFAASTCAILFFWFIYIICKKKHT